MTDQLDTAAIRAKAKMWHLPPGIADSILALCDALDDARQCVSHANLHADCAIADMTALRAENERLRQALEGVTERYVALASSGDAGFWDPEVEPEVIAARAALAQKEGE